jgi:uncharacterized protein YcbX
LTHAYLERIFIYPIKSLDGLALSSATVVYGGALQHDREFALVDAEHRFVNAKRFPAIHHIRATFELEQGVVTLSAPRVGTQRFHLRHEPARLQEYFSDYFGFRVFLVHDAQRGFQTTKMLRAQLLSHTLPCSKSHSGWRA